MRPSEPVRGEDGIFLVLWSVLVIGLMTMVAIVLDLSALRADRRDQRAAADAAVTAGAHVLATQGGANACAVTWEYATTNLGVPSGGTPCGAFPPCSGAPWSVTGTSGGYTITIVHPVLDTNPLLDADAVGPDLSVNLHPDADGVACDRIGVNISSTRQPIFARVIGASGHTTAAHSVARVAPGGPGDEPASLVLLEREHCRAVRTDGANSRLIVAAANGAAGRIQADSAGDTSSPTCGGGKKVVEGTEITSPSVPSVPSILAEHLRDAGGAIVKQARIQIFAKLIGSGNAHTPWPTTVGEPDPIGYKQIGRTPVDERYLENVRALETEASTAVTSAAPFGPSVTYVNVTDPAPAGLGLTCTINTPTPITSGTKFWFNCPGGLTVQNLTIDVADAEVVINGPLSVDSTGFTITDARKVWVRGKTGGNKRGIDLGAPFVVNNNNLATCANRFAVDRTAVGTMFLKEGTLEAANPAARVQWCQMFIYLRGDATTTAASALPTAVTPPPALPPPPGDYGSIGTINVTGGAAIDWTAPNELSALPTTADLAVHKFEDFALWTEAHEQSNLNGGGGLKLGGIYFLPNADPFRITGNSGQSIEVDAQFYVRRLEVRGGSVLRMVPDPSNQVPIPTNVVALIR